MNQDEAAMFARGLRDLLVRFGAEPVAELEQSVHEAVLQMELALGESSDDGASLAPLDVVRIRANKLFARCVPAHVYRDPARLTEARAEILRLARAWLGATGRGSWFEPPGGS